MKVIAVTALALVLQGCNYIFIPGQVNAAIFDSLTGQRGEHCVSEAVKVGDRINLGDGKRGVVESLARSHRCAQVTLADGTSAPIRANIVPY